VHGLINLFCGCGLAAGLWLVVPSTQQPAKSDRLATGKVIELWTSAPGRVQFRLQSKDDKGKDATTWFTTPADKDINTLFENLALSVIRHSLEHGIELNVEAKDTSGADGSVPTKAYDVRRIGLRFAN
jgi:hypothetical protein